MNDFEAMGSVRRNAVWLVVLAALLIFGFFLFKGWDQVVNEEIDGAITTTTGNFSCLPYKDTIGGPKDCVLGVKSRDGLYYALDISRIQDANIDLKAEDNIAVTGVVQPGEVIAGSEWEKFNISGVIKVNTLLRTR